jgi:hypothetical protein
MTTYLTIKLDFQYVIDRRYVTMFLKITTPQIKKCVHLIFMLPMIIFLKRFGS